MVLLTGPWLMKRGALGPAYRGTLRRADKSPVDLSDPRIDHIDFVMRQRRTLEPVVEAEAQIIQEGDADTGTDVGVCEYDWQPGDTDTSGDYYGEFAVYDAEGNVLVRIPNDGYQEIQIIGNLSTPTAPAAPTGVTATAGAGTVVVGWTAPSNGGSPIISYAITPYIGSTAQPAMTIMPATSVTITGLDSGTTYTFTVTASNAVGAGPESAASDSVTTP
jgi:hypothetical protein